MVSALDRAEIRTLASDVVSQRGIPGGWGSTGGRSLGRWRETRRRGMCGRPRGRIWIR